jgi:glutamate--cysteine ligase
LSLEHTSIFQSRIRLFEQPENRSLMCCNLRGIEREALRITTDGEISQKEHPKALGAALTHPSITTDYSEALLEFITEPLPKISPVLEQLQQVHQFTTGNLNQELLWPASMPCRLGDEKDIPIANYGDSNVGTMKSIYRRGLGHRYGRKMQTIAGIHFNFSVPDAVWSQLRALDKSTLTLQEYRTQGYMSLVRNFRRRFWLLLYLMGSSPVVNKSFVDGRPHDLQTLSGQDLYLPFATSLRMGDLGYQSTAQDNLYVCYNNVESYVKSLQTALLQNYPSYENINSADGSGEWQQLSPAVLQIENEFYSTIRPKQTTQSGETQLKALKERGIEYIEVRCVDINPFEPLGINRQQINFLEIFLLGCLFDESPQTSPEEYREILENQKRVVRQGREPNLRLTRNGQTVSLADWGSEMIEHLRPVADILQGLCGEEQYQQTLDEMQNRISNPDLTPSAHVLSDMETHGLDFIEWCLLKANEHHQSLTNPAMDSKILDHFNDLAAKSFESQSDIELNQSESLCEYIQSYFEQYRQL